MLGMSGCLILVAFVVANRSLNCELESRYKPDDTKICHWCYVSWYRENQSLCPHIVIVHAEEGHSATADGLCTAVA